MDKPIPYIRYDQTLVEAECLPEETRGLLLEHRLPLLRHNDEDVLGVHFPPRTDRDFINGQRRKELKLFPIGYEWGESTILTAEQAGLKLEAFRRGEIQPGNKSTSIAARERAVQELRAYYIEKDPASLASEDAWWSVVLEQLEDHLRY